MVSITSTVRPVFLVTLPAVQNIFNLITTENQTHRLPQEVSVLVSTYTVDLFGFDIQQRKCACSGDLEISSFIFSVESNLKGNTSQVFLHFETYIYYMSSVILCLCPTGSHVGVSSFVQHAAAPVAEFTRERAGMADALQQPWQPSGSPH